MRSAALARSTVAFAVISPRGYRRSAMKRPPFTSVGAVGVAAGCAGMVAMLPGAAAGVLGAIGISGSSALARALSPVAEPLFIVSGVLVIVGALACGRLVTLLSVAGTT